jgi:hypothetical protein
VICYDKYRLLWRIDRDFFCLQRLESARKEKEEFEKEMEEERLAAIARDREKMEEKIEEEKKLKDMLKQQMLEIRARDAEV